jgi:23S rRNA (guanosine2251-2'-O)-methyltransferase
MAEAGEKNVPIERVTRKRINRIARTKNAESVIGLKPAPEQISLYDILLQQRGRNDPLFILILNNIHYSQNIGALMRTAYGSGVDAVVISKRKSTYLTEDVTRISMGASERVPVIPMNVFDAIKKLKDAGVRIVGVHMSGTPYYQVPLEGDIALVVGSEDKGVSTRILDRCDSLAQVPMEEGLESLNVSVAGAILMFEKRRQDSMKGK